MLLNFEDNLKKSGINYLEENFKNSIKNVDNTTKNWLLSNYSNSRNDPLSSPNLSNFPRKSSALIHLDSIKESNEQFLKDLKDWDFDIFKFADDSKKLYSNFYFYFLFFFSFFFFFFLFFFFIYSNKKKKIRCLLQYFQFLGIF